MQFEVKKDGYPMKFSIEFRGVYNENELFSQFHLSHWYPAPLRFPQYTVLYELVMDTPWLVKKRHEGYLYLQEFAKQFLEFESVKDMIKKVDEKYLTKSCAVVSFDHAWDKE